MKLQKFLERVYYVNREVAPRTELNYRNVVRAFERWHGKPLKTGDLSVELVNKYLHAMAEQGLSCHTIRSKRSSIRSIWNEAHRQGMASKAGKLRLVKFVDTPKDVWSADEVRRLLCACETLSGRFRTTPIKRRNYFQTIIMAAWDTGLRQGDIHAIRTGSIGDDGKLTLCQRKTSRNITVTFAQPTLAKIREFEVCPKRELIWPLWSSQESFFKAMRKIVLVAGLKGTFKKLRKSSATAVERLKPNTAWVHLGHASPETTRKWYLDPGLWDDRPQPPELDISA